MSKIEHVDTNTDRSYRETLVARMKTYTLVQTEMDMQCELRKCSQIVQVKQNKESNCGL